MANDPRAAKAIFLEAVDVADPDDQAAFLDRACGANVALRRRVEELLRAHDQPADLLDRPPLGSPGDDYVRNYLEPPTRPGSLGRLAHYEVEQIVGRGAFGTVLKAFDDRLHRVVAVKVLAPELAASGTARQRFLREARAAASVRDENVVGIHDVSEMPVPYLVMEYVAGCTLQDKLDQDGPLKVAEILRIGYQTALGLAAAHKQGLVHRDVKPANILLENGVERVKLTDFGLARTIDDASLTQSGVVSGTPAFMSPEQAQGQTLDHRSDLFSLGSTLYALCTGRPPFRAGNTLAVLKRVVEDEPRPIREVNSEIPPELCAVVERLHAKAPDDRFSSAQEVADLLTQCLADLQRPSAPTDHKERERKNDMAETTAKISIKCICGATFSVSAQLAGKKVRCPSCGKVFPVPEAVTKGWYVARDKKKLGPYSPAQLRRMANAGQLLADDMILREGQKQWVKADSVKGLFPDQSPPKAAPAAPRKKRGGGVLLLVGLVAAFFFMSCGGLIALPILFWLVVRVDAVPQEFITENPSLSPTTGLGNEPTARGSMRIDEPRSGLDLKFIPANVSAAIVVHPRKIVQSPLIPALPPDMTAEMVKELGVELKQIEQMILLIQPGSDQPNDPPDKMIPSPGAIVRFTEPIDGKKLLDKMLKGLREAKHQDKVYYLGPDDEKYLGLSMAGHVADARTVMMAPEPLLKKMLTAVEEKSPLIDRLRKIEPGDDLSAVVFVEPFRKVVNLLSNPNQGMLPPPLAGLTGLPDRVACVTASVNLKGPTLARLTFEANDEAAAGDVEKLVRSALELFRQGYPEMRSGLAEQGPPDSAQSLLRLADQLYGGTQITRKDSQVIVTVSGPATPDLPKNLVSASGFNDDKGLLSDPVPGTPFHLESGDRTGGHGELGWAGPWPKHKAATFQKKVVQEGDGALHLTGAPNFGPNYARQLAKAQTETFQVEYYVQVPASSSFVGYVWKGLEGGADASGPNWGVRDGKFTVSDGDEKGSVTTLDTGFACKPDTWYKVTLTIDVAKRQWTFAVDDKRFTPSKPLGFRSKVEYLDTINFLVEGGIYIDAVRVTLPR